MHSVTDVLLVTSVYYHQIYLFVSLVHSYLDPQIQRKTSPDYLFVYTCRAEERSEGVGDETAFHQVGREAATSTIVDNEVAPSVLERHESVGTVELP